MADFKVGDRVVFNCARLSENHHGRTGVLERYVHQSDTKWRWEVRMENFSVRLVYIDAKYLELAPLTPFDTKVRAYIQRELHG